MKHGQYYKLGSTNKASIKTASGGNYKVKQHKPL
uniref:Uncharacterized protein n=1 Tax=Anguilla anguilla TaxID=7936 RepID=A0A0E9R4T3_ANGAN